MDEASKADAGDVAGGAEYAFEVPDCFCSAKRLAWYARAWRSNGVRFRVELVKEAASVVFMEDAGEAPWVILEGLDVLNLNEEDVTWLGGLDLEGTGEVVDLSQIDVLDIVGTIVVGNLSTCPVDTFDLDDFTILDGAAEGDYERISRGL